MKETLSSRIDRLKAVPAEEVIRRVEAAQARTRRTICASSVQHGSGNTRPDLKPKTPVDFLFKSHNKDFQESMSHLEQLLKLLKNQSHEHRKKQSTRRREFGMSC